MSRNLAREREASRVEGLLKSMRRAGMWGGPFDDLCDSIEDYLLERLRDLAGGGAVAQRPQLVPIQDRHPRVNLESRRLPVLRRHGPICGICGNWIDEDDELHIDHVVPLALGGTNDLENLQPAHAKCNLRKGTDSRRTPR